MVRYGVPQGLLLFLIFINNLSLTLKNVISSDGLYADDTTLYDIQPNKAQIENNLQHAFDLLHTWCLENWMLLHGRQSISFIVYTSGTNSPGLVFENKN